MKPSTTNPSWRLFALLALAGLVMDRREGRFIFYSLRDPALLDLVQAAARLQRLEVPVLVPSSGCDCPNCRCKREET